MGVIEQSGSGFPVVIFACDTSLAFAQELLQVFATSHKVLLCRVEDAQFIAAQRSFGSLSDFFRFAKISRPLVIAMNAAAALLRDRFLMESGLTRALVLIDPVYDEKQRKDVLLESFLHRLRCPVLLIEGVSRKRDERNQILLKRVPTGFYFYSHQNSSSEGQTKANVPAAQLIQVLLNFLHTPVRFSRRRR